MGFLGSLLAANLLFLVLVNQPRQRAALTADAITAGLSARVRKAEDRVAHLREVVDELKQSREAFDRFFEEDLSSKVERLVAVQKEVHKIAKTFQVEASQIKFNHEKVKGSDLIRLAVDMPLNGGYNNLRQFVHSVESSKLFLIIESIQLQEGDQGGALLNLNIRLATYFTQSDLPKLRYRWKS